MNFLSQDTIFWTSLLAFVFLPYDGPGDGQARIPSADPVLAGLVLGPEHLVIYRVVPLNKLADSALCFW